MTTPNQSKNERLMCGRKSELQFSTPNQSTPAPRVNTEHREYPHPDHASIIQFEGCSCVVMSPESYEELWNIATTLERELAEARQQLANGREVHNAACHEIKRLREAKEVDDSLIRKLGDKVKELCISNQQMTHQLATKDDEVTALEKIGRSMAEVHEMNLTAKDEELTKLKEMEETWHRGAMEHSRIKGERDSLRGIVASVAQLAGVNSNTDAAMMQSVEGKLEELFQQLTQMTRQRDAYKQCAEEFIATIESLSNRLENQTGFNEPSRLEALAKFKNLKGEA